MDREYNWTVVKSGGGVDMNYALSDVGLADSVTSAVVTVTSDEGSPVVAGRALGVAHDCMVEVELVYDDPADRGLAAERAIRLVEAMLSRVKTS